MRKYNVLVLFSIVFWLLYACDPSEMSIQEMNNYIRSKDSGLNQSYSRNGLNLEVLYKPNELIWINDITKEGEEEARKSIAKNFENKYYFMAIYSTPGVKDMDPLSRLSSNRSLYKKILSRLSFNFKDFAKIRLSDGEVINADGSNFSKSFGMIPNNQVLFFFNDERLKTEQKLELIIEDIGFDMGFASFTFSQKDIKRLPKLLHST